MIDGMSVQESLWESVQNTPVRLFSPHESPIKSALSGNQKIDFPCICAIEVIGGSLFSNDASAGGFDFPNYMHARIVRRVIAYADPGDPPEHSGKPASDSTGSQVIQAISANVWRVGNVDLRMFYIQASRSAYDYPRFRAYSTGAKMRIWGPTSGLITTHAVTDESPNGPVNSLDPSQIGAPLSSESFAVMLGEHRDFEPDYPGPSFMAFWPGVASEAGLPAFPYFVRFNSETARLG